jgi:hypothetical protein
MLLMIGRCKVEMLIEKVEVLIVIVIIHSNHLQHFSLIELFLIASQPD